MRVLGAFQWRAFRVMSIVREFIGWVVGDFIPSGDLVSDVLLWISLPHDKPDSYDCSATSYTAARTALAVATIVDSFPEVSVLLAIVAGVVAALVFGPAYLSTGENEQALREICSSLWQCLRCVAWRYFRQMCLRMLCVHARRYPDSARVQNKNN